MNSLYEEYMKSPEWKDTARQRREQDNCICCVCGKEATQVHHLCYDHLGNERWGDLVSLCPGCHQEAEKIADSKIYPFAMEEEKPGGNNFMAAMRVDARRIAPVVFDYLTEVRGSNFEALMSLRQPNGGDKQRYWGPLADAVNALCRRRYARNLIEDRRDIMIDVIADRVQSICMAEIEHCIRNCIQKDLQKIAQSEYERLGKLSLVEKELNISKGTLHTIRSNDGTSFGPSLRENVLLCCGLDAAAGIRPIEGFECLTDEDYKTLNAFADYMADVSGSGAFKGEAET